jgi:hypothetical protein
MQGQQGRDYVPDEAAEIDLAEKIITAYVNDASEASFAELRDVLQRCAIDPRLVMSPKRKRPGLCTGEAIASLLRGNARR